MNSGAPTSPKKGGGILRSRKRKSSIGHGAPVPAPGRVTFSGPGDDGGGMPAPSPRAPLSDADRGYESDDVEDAVLASGEAAALGRRDGAGDESDADAAVRTAAEIDEARRQRGRVRRREGEHATGAVRADVEAGNGTSEDDPCASLITDRAADPDAYESNAAEHAACPVEPFNMEAEKEGGLGYFDGDTYVFRHNGKPRDGEEDAWLDGVGDEEEGGGGTGPEGGVGGLDATAVWTPRPAATTEDKRSTRKSTFVDEDATPEDLARRVATLLQRDDETVMAALTRHGASLRKLQAQAQQRSKKTRPKGRKSSKHHGSEKGRGSGANEPPPSGAGPDAQDLKRETDAAREAVEELTELADALLFGGEADAYDHTRRDWVRRFELERHFPSAPTKRPPAPTDAAPAKKKSRGYFEDASADGKEEGAEKAATTKPRPAEVTWEYKGNEDGAVHGPYTSRQMWEWTSGGYFVGESAVDIRRVEGNSSEVSGKDTKRNNSGDGETDADDLLADLLEGDDDDRGETNTAAKGTGEHGAESSWMRSDRVDFRSYL